MIASNSQVYQFKITLIDIEPTIWRRIQVPSDYSFWDLHVAIQDAMGWTDCHLHVFKILCPRTDEEVEIGIPVAESREEMLDGKEEKIRDYFMTESRGASYRYDLCDDWLHSIYLEEISDADLKKAYPICVDGERACPPEDIGGIWGYEVFLETVSDPENDMNQDVLERFGDWFDAEQFDPNAIVFDDPGERWRVASEGYSV